MLKSKTNWNYLNEVQLNDYVFENKEIAQLTPIVQQLLIQRGIVDDKEAEKFLNPNLADLHNPIQLSMIERAVERIQTAIAQDEKIMIYGDYDADGVCSTVVLLKTLQELNANCDFYIPNRFTEGYGPNKEAFQAIAEAGYDVIVTVDCGIAGFAEAELAGELGLDLIITDHHEIQNEIPEAYAVINPKSSDDYPFKELAGVGVAWKLSQLLLGYMPEHLLEFVAIGTIADLVPLRGENRILAYHGLQHVQTTKNYGLQALKEVSGLNGELASDDIGFVIGPRINAVGRIADASLAVELFMTETSHEAKEIAFEVDALNKKRQQIVNDIVKEADAQVDPTKEHEMIIVQDEGWNEGVIGIVASRLVEKYNRPTIVFSVNKEKGWVKGSARSIERFNLFDACMEHIDLFISFGGHSQAAGMTVPIESVDRLRENLNDYLTKHLTAEDFEKEVYIHQTMDIADINERLVREIEQLEPFGMENEKPIFHIEAIPNDIRMLGANRNHLKLQMNQDNVFMECIGFNFDHYDLFFSPQTAVSVIGELGINEWNGKRTVQMIIQDLKVKESQVYDFRGKDRIDLDLFFKRFKSNVVLAQEVDNMSSNELNVTYLSYGDSCENLTECETLYILDMPQSSEELERMIQQINPKNILVNFRLQESLYLKPFPSREQFKNVYAYLFKKKSVHLEKELEQMMRLTSLDEETTRFILAVFNDLQFISIEEQNITLNEQSIKRDLTESTVYQMRKEAVKVEKTLYYSNYKQLLDYFSSCLNSHREEVIHGL